MLEKRGEGEMIHELTYYLMTRGLWLTYAYLAAAILTLVQGEEPWLAGWYARYYQSLSVVMFGTSLIGPLLVEDVLRGRG